MTAWSRTIVDGAALFVLVASRIIGFVAVSPFPGQQVGTTQRAGLVVVLSWIVASFAPGGARVAALDLTFVWRAVVELGCGLVLGISFFLVFSAADVLGSLLGVATGLSTPSVMDPAMGAPETVVARAVSLGAMLVALAAGVHRVALGALLESFRAVPIGTVALEGAPLMRLVDLGVDAFTVGVRLATPVVAVSLLVQLALALVSRAAPSLQIFSVGLALLIVSGLVTLVACLDDLMSGLAAHFASLGPFIDDALAGMRR